ncbi:MAG: DNA polymerase III subunit alpha [Candidatus Marinimicrobia bacterium]|nr:DNA polymerase III subunit alpha [Candidatus Neomarinimicrobiota bacterium]
MFCHLNTHSNFSAMMSTITIRDLLLRAKEYGQKAIALTEVNSLRSFIHFIQKARDLNILPIAGTNIITDHFDLILLAENQKGYENICHIISDVKANKAITLQQLFEKQTAGVFILSHQVKVTKELRKFIPSSHLFVELRCGMSENDARFIARENGLEVVATGDVYFIHPQEHKAHKILRAIEKNTTLSALTAKSFKSPKNYFRNEEEMIELFPNSLDAINNTYYLAERCKTDWNFVDTIFPNLNLRHNHKANKDLRKLVYQGARLRYDTITPEIEDRIEYELSIITQKGFSPYFLVVYDIVKNSQSATIGRGSGAASIVSYCLFITQVDPIQYNLVFERFIHPERVDMPDIDIDFPWDERDNVLDYVFRKYGTSRTAMVASQVFLQPRSAIRETGKVFGLSNEEIKAVTKRIGFMSRPKELVKWVKSNNRFKNLNLDEDLLEIIRQSDNIRGVFRYPSVHPGGVIIVPDDMRNYVPVEKAPKGVNIIEWEKDQTEDSGLLKIDLLGNRSLAVVRDTIKMLKLYRNIHLDYYAIRGTDDEKTRQLMETGQTMGVFYIESPATRQLLTKAGVADFEHVVIYSSIIRPAANRFINLMLERIHGKPWNLIHPDLKCLEESYGIMVYEEQVSMVARQVAGFSYKESDYLRKVISRPNLQEVKPQWKNNFFRGAEKRGYPRQLATDLWSMIESFSGYSFCKPHSASFARLSFTCAYLKANYPAEFLAAVISNQGGFYSAFAYVSEGRRFGITILKPDINLSEVLYKGRKDKIRMGFMAIQRLKHTTVDLIIKERKNRFFTSLMDFFQRVEIDFSDAMILTDSGCFYGIEPGMSHKEIAYNVAIHCLTRDHNEPKYIPEREGDLPLAELLKMENEAFGFPVTRHPLYLYSDILQGRTRKAINLAKYKNRVINLAGVKITRKVTSTKKHQPMEFVTFEDETDIYECVMFPEIYKEFGDLLNWEQLFVVRGKVEEAWGVYTVTVERLYSLSKIAREQLKTIAAK